MTATHDAQLIPALAGIWLPESVFIRAWCEEDFADVQKLSAQAGWITPIERPKESFAGWCNAWPALVAVRGLGSAALGGDEMIGFARAITDGSISTYICELLVDMHWRRFGIGEALLAACHNLYPTTRIDLLAGEDSRSYYEHLGCHPSYGFRKSRLI